VAEITISRGIHSDRSVIVRRYRTITVIWYDHARARVCVCMVSNRPIGKLVVRFAFTKFERRPACRTDDEIRESPRFQVVQRKTARRSDAMVSDEGETAAAGRRSREERVGYESYGDGE